MKLPNIRREATWLIPGLSIKRWVIISIVGVFLLVFGLTLALGLQPVSFVIDILKAMAVHVPNHISGPIMVVAGAILAYFGAKKVSGTVFNAMELEGSEASILEAIYRRSKLLNGPRIVAIGGGTGLSTLLRGIKNYTSNVVAVVTVGDDGGSSGRLREEQGIIPPGDIRNCIAALANEEKLITELFQYRFKTGTGLEGHSFGNLFLTAMCRITGDMMSAIKESSKVLNIRGRVLPSTLDNMKLVAEMDSGEIVEGESNIPNAKGKIKRLMSNPEHPTPLPEVIKAIEQAELIILGPGSLYTSVIPNLLLREISASIAKSKAPKVYVANVMTQPGETDGFSVGDHIQSIIDHAGFDSVISAVIVNSSLPQELVDRYHMAGYEPVVIDTERCNAMGIEVVTKPLVDAPTDNLSTQVIRHNPKQLARGIVDWFKAYQRRKGKQPQTHAPLLNAELLAPEPVSSQR
ncbi:MAG: gluconeogenesis factor YvcK family protein [Vampirovibrionales bacterium]|nr:gluconeogenesis factor YvcK family protein [Vampirovibrionales bacterium]